ncbi:unnamed protein product [Aphanomyces euteiches]|uniref:Uncharacterized protein n=1 Tax=Aphanomyces euteiches TaxID=100861 RepID=A0A6G0XBQ3_9STRA|nr:hypothetical protein Ae201684_006741 [Aphanomyces euteiches]KAH9091161.1 hypothetical protein Ae201684P_006561 [Aphanomyces euteiches]KAH9133318.1 hypothetical protein AeRB84_020580 [Aphanomyces euteiches]
MDVRLMSPYRKRKFFADVDKIYPLTKTSHPRLDLFDAIVAETPHFASIRALLEESRTEAQGKPNVVDSQKLHRQEEHPSTKEEGSSARTQTLLLPVTQTQLVAEIVPETVLEPLDVKLEIVPETKASDDMLKHGSDGDSTAVKSSLDSEVNEELTSTLEIVPETKLSDGKEHHPTKVESTASSTEHPPVLLFTVSANVEPEDPRPVERSIQDFSEADTSIDNSIVPSISFHPDESRDGMDNSSIFANDSFAAFPIDPSLAVEEAPTPPTQQSHEPSPPGSTSTTKLVVLNLPSYCPVDYYDADSFTEIIPCWILESPCLFHDPHLQYPNLLFYIQTLDLYLLTSPSTPNYFRTACLVARRVFVELWHAKNMAHTSLEVQHYLERGNTLPGVATPVWRYLEAQWRQLHSILLHTNTFWTSQAPANPFPPQDVLLALDDLQTYGRLASLASDYLLPIPATTYRPALHARHVVSAVEMQQALRGLQSQLKCPVFSMGTFRRGGIFLSVLDVLAVTPSSMADLVALLRRAKVLESDVMHVTNSRVIAPIRFNSYRLVLDLKAYAQPQASFAMLYFTGPASYVATLLQEPSMSFDAWYDSIVTRFGVDQLRENVTDEASACRVLKWPYQAPKDRLG